MKPTDPILSFVLCVFVLGGVAALCSCVNGQNAMSATCTATPLYEQEGLRIIRGKFPGLCTGLKPRYSEWNSEQAAQRLVYSSEEAQFWLNAATGEVDALIILNAVSDADASIDVTEAREIAVRLIGAYRPDFDLSAMKQTESRFIDSITRKLFRFEWRELRDGVEVGNVINVELTSTGELMSYTASSFDNPDVDTKIQKMTEDQAVNVIRNYLKPQIPADRFSVMKVKESRLFVYLDRVCWRIEMSSQPAGDPVTYYYMITIDAQTGEVLDDARG